MYDFFIHAAILVWSVIFTLIGTTVLLVLIGLATNWIFVTMVNRINNPKNEENIS